MAELPKTIEACEQQSVNVKNFIKIAHRYIAPTEPAPDILHELVSRIIVHTPDMSTGQRTQQIDIRYNFVGEIDLSGKFAKRETA